VEQQQNPHTTVVDFRDMPRGRPSPKVAITIDPDVYEGVLAAAAAAGTSVSGWLTEAARETLTIEDGLCAVAEFEHEHGAFTEAERAAADARVDAMLAGPPLLASPPASERA
jgi:hypothetical protein